MQSTSDNLCVYQVQKVISEIGGRTNYGREELKNFNDYLIAMRGGEWVGTGHTT